MKKLFLLSFTFLLCLILSGCGNKNELTCSITQKDNGATMSQTVNVRFVETRVSNIKMTIHTQVSEVVSKNDWNNLINMLDEEYEEVNHTGFQLIKDNNDSDRTCNITMTVDINKASKDDLSEYGLDNLVDAQLTYDAVKEQMEKSGLTCE